ncbi:MAG: DUF1559 domain-containing protein [Planctomycetaceae bacterium]|nr:DUF1559 domain-containing protein [Planctomycetaceae bacterium]
MANFSTKSNAMRAGFSLVELLVVMGIISMLIGLLMPAVQSAREGARRTQCVNNLHQIGLAVLQHEAAHQYFPTGGWGSLWVGDPDCGTDENQPGGWLYNILPYLEQQAVHDLGMGKDANAKASLAVEMQGIPIPGVHCPSRRIGGLYKHSQGGSAYNASGQADMEARSDYAANAGDRWVDMGKGPIGFGDSGYQWPDVSKMTGICYLRSKIQYSDITDGATNTYLVGEKWMDVNHYGDGAGPGDERSLYQGASPDILRWVAKKPGEYWRSCEDDKKPVGCDCGLLPFGSCHPGVWNVTFCDGSVHTLSFDMDPESHRRLGCRNDGKRIGEAIP